MTLPLVPFLSFGQIEGKRTFLACARKSLGSAGIFDRFRRGYPRDGR